MLTHTHTHTQINSDYSKNTNWNGSNDNMMQSETERDVKCIQSEYSYLSSQNIALAQTQRTSKCGQNNLQYIFISIIHLPLMTTNVASNALYGFHANHINKLCIINIIWHHIL